MGRLQNLVALGWGREAHCIFHLPDHINSRFSDSQHDLVCALSLWFNLENDHSPTGPAPGEEPSILLPVTL